MTKTPSAAHRCERLRPHALRRVGRGALAVLLALLAATAIPSVARADNTTSGSPVSLSASSGATVATGTTAPSVATQSGISGKRLTLAQLTALWQNLPEEPNSDVAFSTPSDTTSSDTAYTAGVLTDDALAYSQAYINFMRQQAGLDTITLDSTLNANAAQGALILAKLNKGLDHFPSTPDKITDAQAKAGKYATATSNLSESSSYGGHYNFLSEAIGSFMDDSSPSNREMIGHRRWLLNPGVKQLGIGAAGVPIGEWNCWYTAVRVMDNPWNEELYDSSYGTTNTTTRSDYDFIAWPASGDMLNSVFRPGTVWSITLNPAEYSMPSASSVKVTVTRKSDGTVWNFSSGSTPTGGFFNVDTNWYAVPNAIIFNPGSSNVGSSYEGAYHVDVSGITSKSGTAVTLSYDVNFSSPTQPDTPSQPTTPDSGNQQTQTVTMYRLYNQWSGEHLFTESYDEYQYLCSLGWNGEGRAWLAPAKSNTPIYRLYNPYSGDHHYTSSKSEYDQLCSIGWNGEGIMAYSDDQQRVPIYRLFNRWLTQGTHLYTTSWDEYCQLGAIGWNQESIAFYAVSK